MKALEAVFGALIMGARALLALAVTLALSFVVLVVWLYYSIKDWLGEDR